MKMDQSFTLILIKNLNSVCMEQWRVLGSVYINNCAYSKSLVEVQSAHSETCGGISGSWAFSLQCYGGLTHLRLEVMTLLRKR